LTVEAEGRRRGMKRRGGRMNAQRNIQKMNLEGMFFAETNMSVEAFEDRAVTGESPHGCCCL
jgi:hypothetical protein